MANSQINNVQNALAIAFGKKLTYNPERNVFLTMGFTSTLGNTYYNAMRLSSRILVCYEIGEGYKHTFLNGITIFRIDNNHLSAIAQRVWGGCNWVKFSELVAANLSIDMLTKVLKDDFLSKGIRKSDDELISMSRCLIKETFTKQIA